MLFPNWIMLLSLIILTITEFMRLYGALINYQGIFGFIIAGLVWGVLWVVPVECMGYLINDTKKEVKNPIWRYITKKLDNVIIYPTWLLWIVLIIGVIFKLGNVLSYSMVRVGYNPIMNILFTILIAFFTIIIPYYCIWIIVTGKRTDSD